MKTLELRNASKPLAHYAADLDSESIVITSNEKPVAVLDLVQRILDLMGSRLQPDVRNEARHEIAMQILTAEKAHRVLGWSPSFSLDEGLRRTIDWYAESLEAAA